MAQFVQPMVVAEGYEESAAFSHGWWLAHPPPGEEVVISGLAGKYPDSDDVYHFRDNLYNKVDMVSCDARRWEPTHPEIPQRTGKINAINKFDPGFFGIHHRQAHSLDPMLRLLLERTVEAVLDAGVHPSDMEGTRTGVFIGACFSESEKTWFFDKLHPQTFGFTGCERSMLANRVSYFLKLQGPSYVVDTACSSSLYALENAYQSIRRGECDMALVGGCNLCLHPFVSLQFARLGVLSPDGSCKVFDNKGNGYARSEAVSVILLQKSKDAKRVYAQIVHAKTNCDGYKEQGITFPSGGAQNRLLQEFYKECGVSPYELSFLEAHGTGTKVGDPEEVSAIDVVFCKGRKTPLLVGSVKSNIGHSEPSSGLCSITKVIIGMENGLIPPNLYYTTPREGVMALEQGRLKVVTEKTPFEDDRGLIGVNSFGFGGGNCHILLRWNPKIKINYGLPKDDLPRLIPISGRTEESIHSVLDDIVSRKLDVEYVGLYHQIFRKDVEGHPYRGFGIVSKSGEVLRSCKCYKNDKKRFYLIFTETISGWFELLQNLYRTLPLFAQSVKRIDNILQKKDIYLLNILNNSHSLEIGKVLGSAILQICLVDVFQQLNLKPDGVLGLGYADLICAYFFNCLKLNDILNIFINISQNNFDFNEIVTSALNAKNDKWLTTVNNCGIASIQYFQKSFKQSSKDLIRKVEKDSVVFIIENHIIDQINTVVLSFDQISKDFLGLVQILGKLYEFGQNPQISKLYPEIEFPVSRGTPMISPLVKWDHSQDWFVTYYKDEDTLKSGERSVSVTLKEEDWQFIAGHVIDGRNLFPATGYLNLAWEALALIRGMMTSDMQVVFENCKFLRATNIPKDTKTELIVMVQRGSGRFEVIESSAPIVTGKISEAKNFADQQVNLPLPIGMKPSEALPLSNKDIYKELKLRGYNYKGAFRKILECDNSATKGLIEWDGNWITFMDNMLQMMILQLDTRSLYVPTRIKHLSIDAKQHLAYAQTFGENPKLPVYVYRDCGIIKCGSIEIRGLNASSIPRRKPLSDPVLETYTFMPNDGKLTTKEAIRVDLQLALENSPSIKVKVIELVDEASREELDVLSPIICQTLSDLPLIQQDITVLSKKPMELSNIVVEDKKLQTETDCFLVVGTNLLQRSVMLGQAFTVLKENGYVLSRESIDFVKNDQHHDIDVLTTFCTKDETLVLLRRTTEYKHPMCINVNDTTDFTWLPVLQECLKNKAPNIVAFSQNDNESGILGLVNCVRREPGGNNVKCVFLCDPNAPPFNAEHPFYQEHLKKNLVINVYKNGLWGTYRHLLLSENYVDAEHCFVSTTVRGDLSSLRWIEGPLTSSSVLQEEQTLLQVYCTALNFRDIMTASGRINADVITLDRAKQDCLQGFEFSGRTLEGKRMMGITVCGALSTMVAADSCLLWDVPDYWSLEDAATVPVVYSTVLYAFFVRTKIKRGESILVHSGTGGVGQAAIGIALFYGLTVYTTVGTPSKRDYLKKRFPQLTDNHIGNSRDTSFEQMIFNQTHGRGVDYVLNSLAEEKLLASVRCLARGGHFLEIGKFDFANDNSLKLLLLQKEISFHGIMLDEFYNKVTTNKKLIHDLIVKGVTEGSIQPLPRTVFKKDDIEQAFRFMTSGKHTGKVLIRLRQEEVDKRTVVPEVRLEGALSKYYCSPEGVYVIVGGMGGFGLELADWLILRGARKLILNSRSGLKNGYQSLRVRLWRSYGATVRISTEDVTTEKGCAELIQNAQKLGEVYGIYNLAVVLRDAIFENQTVEGFRASFAPKADASRHLDGVSRRLCPNLRDFVVFSSVSCGRGNAGQTNYGMANSVMERVCERRRSEGLPALAVQWGAVGDVGLVADMQEDFQELEIGGTLQQRIASCLHVLDALLRQSSPIVASMVVAEKRSGAGSADNVVDAVANILGLKNLKTVSLHATLAELGMDSMTAVEIKQTLEREFEVFLTPQDIRGMTFARLKEIQEEKEAEKEGTVARQERPLEGFDLLVRVVNDEASSRVPIVRLDSKCADDGGAYQTIVLVPGLEGVAGVLRPLAANLSLVPMAVQYDIDDPGETIPEIAESLIPRIVPLLSKSKPFNILGYSFGCAVAMELVAQLEAKGYFGSLICLDGSPKMLLTLLNSNVDVSSEAHFQTGLLCQLMSTYMPLELIIKNKDELLKAESLEQRLEISVKILPKEAIHSPSYQKQVAVALYKRLKALMVYQPSFPKLKTCVKLFRPEQASVPGIADDYHLGELCEKPVEVTKYPGNHVTVLDNVEMALAVEEAFSMTRELFVKETLLLNETDKNLLTSEIKHI